MPNLSTPQQAREHARARAESESRIKPSIPASAARDLPPGIEAADMVWDETIGAGGYSSRVITRGTRLRFINLDGDACVNLLVFNADRPTERLNVADTAKVQWNGYLGKGTLVLSDLGHVLMSGLEDTGGKHDMFCGCSTEKSNEGKYGCGENFSPYPNARDRFLVALQKHGLGKRDIASNLNLFQSVRVEPDGQLTFVEQAGRPGDYIEFRAEMNLLVVLANTPHVLDPRTTYTCTPVRVLAYRGPLTPAADPLRTASADSLRIFQYTEDYYTV